MTNIARHTAVFLLTSALIAGCWYNATSHDRQAGPLRNSGDRYGRKLQQRFIATTLNALVGIVTPAISGRVQHVVVEYYNYYNFDNELGYETNPQFLGDVTWMAATPNNASDREESSSSIPSTNATAVPSTAFSCEEEARVDYKIISLDGFGAISIDTISFVQNSQSIRLKFQNMQAGASWLGEWRVKASFPTLIAATTASLTTMSDADVANTECSDNSRVKGAQPQSANGTIRFADVTIDANVLVKGETDRLVVFAGTSEFASATILSLSYDYDSVDTSGTGTFSLFNTNDEEPVRVASYLLEEGDGGTLETYLEVLLTEALQAEIDYYLPRPLIP